MNSEEIRARIAELEAEAEQRAQSEPPRRGRPGASPADGANSDGDPWDFLFDAALRAGDGLGPDGFSLSGWLADGLFGLRGALRGLGVNDEFRGHLRAAERELLLACRVSDRHPPGAPGSRGRRRRNLQPAAEYRHRLWWRDPLTRDPADR